MTKPHQVVLRPYKSEMRRSLVIEARKIQKAGSSDYGEILMGLGIAECW